MHENVVGQRPGRRAALLGLALLISSFALLALRAPASEAASVEKDAVLLETEEAPWGDTFNVEAMEAAFGTNWERQEFSSVQADARAGGLFAPDVEFIWIEGSDQSTEAAAEFVTAHEAELKAFVARGGSLFIDSASNQEIPVEYDGRIVGPAGEHKGTSTAQAVDPSLPIFNEPEPLSTTDFTGGYFAHWQVTGAEVTPLIVSTDSGGGTAGDDVLGIYESGLGHVVLGTLTVQEYEEPPADTAALRINLLDYLKKVARPGPTETKVTPPTTTVTATASTTSTATPVCTVPTLMGMTLKAAKAALRAANCGLDHVAHRPSIKLKEGKVIRQRPVVGTVRGAGSEVSFRLGRG